MIFSKNLVNIDSDSLMRVRNKINSILKDDNFFENNSPEYIKALLNSYGSSTLLINYAKCLMYKYVFDKSNSKSFLVTKDPHLEDTIHDYFLNNLIKSTLLPIGYYANVLLGLSNDNVFAYDSFATFYDIDYGEDFSNNPDLETKLFDIVDHHIPQEITFYSISSKAIDKYIVSNKVDISNIDGKSTTFFYMTYMLYLCNIESYLKAIELMKIVKSTNPNYKYELIFACSNKNSFLKHQCLYSDKELIPKLNKLKDFLCSS